MTPGHSDSATATAEAKAALRKRVRSARRARLEADGTTARRRDAEALADHGMEWLTRAGPGGGLPRCVTAYDPMRTEPPADLLVTRLREAGVRVLVPVTLGEGRLRWRDADPQLRADPLHPEEFDGPSWGEEIMSRIDAALVPALAIGADGTRLGQGGGYFDRWVPAVRAVRPDTEMVAVVYAEEFGADVPADSHDIRVDAVLTPDGPRRVTLPAPGADGPGSRP